MEADRFFAGSRQLEAVDRIWLEARMHGDLAGSLLATVDPVPLSYKLGWKPGASWLEAVSSLTATYLGKLHFRTWLEAHY